MNNRKRLIDRLLLKNINGDSQCEPNQKFINGVNKEIFFMENGKGSWRKASKLSKKSKNKIPEGFYMKGYGDYIG